MVLDWFLELGKVLGACSAFTTGWPGIAIPPKIIQKKSCNSTFRNFEKSDHESKRCLNERTYSFLLFFFSGFIVSICSTPLPCSGYDRRSISNWSTAGVESEFSSRLVSLPNLKSLVYPTMYILLKREQIDLCLLYMQRASFCCNHISAKPLYGFFRVYSLYKMRGIADLE